MARRPKLKGIAIAGNYAVDDGKLVAKPSAMASVSQKIASRKSKRVRVKRRTPC